jgi:hypothetical protein
MKPRRDTWLPELVGGGIRFSLEEVLTRNFNFVLILTCFYDLHSVAQVDGSRNISPASGITTIAKLLCFLPSAEMNKKSSGGNTGVTRKANRIEKLQPFCLNGGIAKNSGFFRSNCFLDHSDVLHH